MRLLRTIAVTFAQYSRIPMPMFGWEDDDMTYSMSVFPWVGAVIGLIYTGVFLLSVRVSVPAAAAALLLAAVPAAVTGGFHIDGFMDVSDALSSYGSREDKLRILKDPHIGAFAVIRLGLCSLIYIASTIIILSSGRAASLIYINAAGFFLARALSAAAVLNFRSAKKEGMLFYEASSAGKGRKVNNTFTLIWIICAAGAMLYADIYAGAVSFLCAVLTFGYCRYKSYKEFGGITGDTAGWFVTLCETAIAAGAAAAAVIM